MYFVSDNFYLIISLLYLVGCPASRTELNNSEIKGTNNLDPKKVVKKLIGGVNYSYSQPIETAARMWSWESRYQIQDKDFIEKLFNFHAGFGHYVVDGTIKFNEYGEYLYRDLQSLRNNTDLKHKIEGIKKELTVYIRNKKQEILEMQKYLERNKHLKNGNMNYTDLYDKELKLAEAKLKIIQHL
jgi:hypothetical protein